jgi:hypothetical protein
MNTAFPADSRLGVHLVDDIVEGVVITVADEMRGQPSPMVMEILEATLARRLPGIAYDRELLSLAAARIAVGLPPF